MGLFRHERRMKVRRNEVAVVDWVAFVDGIDIISDSKCRTGSTRIALRVRAAVLTSEDPAHGRWTNTSYGVVDSLLKKKNFEICPPNSSAQRACQELASSSPDPSQAYRPAAAGPFGPKKMLSRLRLDQSHVLDACQPRNALREDRVTEL